MEVITISLLGSHHLMLEAWRALLEEDPRFFVVQISTDLDFLTRALKHWKPDILIVDNLETGDEGIGLVRELIRTKSNTRVLASYADGNEYWAVRMEQVGAAAKIGQGVTKEEMMDLLVRMHGGDQALRRIT